jgi:hypothetical protein
MTHQEAVDTLAPDRYLLDEMSGSEREAFEEHYFSCHDCADELRAGAALIEGAKSGMASSKASGQVVPMRPPRAKREDSKASVERTAWYRSAALPWAVAATLAVAVGYQSRTVVPARVGSPMVLSPVTLRPESRGREPVVPRGTPDRPLTLSIDINGARPDAELQFLLNRDDGSTVASGKTPAPPAGAPLLLVIPNWTAMTPAHYSLTVQDTATRQELGQYRFAIGDGRSGDR